MGAAGSRRVAMAFPAVVSSSLPSALRHWSSFEGLARGRRLAVFLDYDGTLSHIVPEPDKAFMTEDMRSVVRRIARRCPCAIISGRGRGKVFDFVRLEELYYAGSHGMDIKGPNRRPPAGEAQEGAAEGDATKGSSGGGAAGGTEHSPGDSGQRPPAGADGGEGAAGGGCSASQEAANGGSQPARQAGTGAGCEAGRGCVELQPAAEYVEMLDLLYAELVRRLEGIPGAEVEHNKFCLSVHYRRVDEAQWERVWAIVDEVFLPHEQSLKLTTGRKVLEIKPRIDWHKGRALSYLLEALGLADDPATLPIYLGDDVTDEDAFRCLRARSLGGAGILVTSVEKDTAATFTLHDPDEVQEFLGRVAAMLEEAPEGGLCEDVAGEGLGTNTGVGRVEGTQMSATSAGEGSVDAERAR